MDAGFVSLTGDATIARLEMNGGALVTHDSTCLSGWTPAPGGTSASFGSTKCYRVFGNATTWTKAQSTCASADGPRNAGFRGGALRGALVSVEGLDENQWVARLCRGDSMDRDCWVGLTRRYKGGNGAEAGSGVGLGSGGDLEWAEVGMMLGETRYRSWPMREPSSFEGDEVCMSLVSFTTPPVFRGQLIAAHNFEPSKHIQAHTSSLSPIAIPVLP